MAPPVDNAALNDMWKKLNRQLDLGTVYTMIAGLLNVLAIYDAYGGPVRLEPEEQPPGKKEEDDPGEKSGG